MPTATLTANGYRATRTAEALTIHRVPIFCECYRETHSEDSGFDGHYDAKWITAAVAKAQQAAQERYYPPLHIRHHEQSTEANDSVRAAGYFKILGSEPIVLKGARRVAIFADLVITDPAAQEEVLANRLPYRSVEIFDVEKPRIDGLALLDHEAPFLELPMLMVSDVEERGGVADATFRQPWSIDARASDSPLVACFRRGKRAHFLFRADRQEDIEMAKETKTTDPEPKQVELFTPDGKPKDKDDKDKGEKMEDGGGVDGKTCAKAIADGTISLGDFEMIEAAIAQRRSETMPEEEQAPAPAAAPGAEAMKAKPSTMTEQMAALRGKNDALESRIDANDAAASLKEDVAVALKRLEGRPLGDLDKLNEKLVTFRKESGPGKLWSAYVDSYAKNTGTLPDDDGKEFHGTQGKAPEVAMKYREQGTDAIDRATKHGRDWEELKGTGMSLSQERYVELSMQEATA